MPSIAILLRGTGALLILHAAYSCLHYRSILADLDLLETEAVPPIDVAIELVVAFVVLLAGELIGMGPLQSVEVLLSSNDDAAANGGSSKPPTRRNLVAPAHKTRDFDVYTNRSRMLVYRSASGSTIQR